MAVGQKRGGLQRQGSRYCVEVTVYDVLPDGVVHTRILVMLGGQCVVERDRHYLWCRCGNKSYAATASFAVFRAEAGRQAEYLARLMRLTGS